MLRVSLSEALSSPVETVGEIAPSDPSFAGLELPLAAPIRVSGRFSSAGDEKYYWKVQFETAVRGECRRCLTEVVVPVQESRGLIFSSDEDIPEGDGVYEIDPRSQVLDLTVPLREEVLLAAPRFIECRPDCKGLCPRCGANLNDGPCSCAPASDPRWDALKGLTANHPRKD